MIRKAAPNMIKLVHHATNSEWTNLSYAKAIEIRRNVSANDVEQQDPSQWLWLLCNPSREDILMGRLPEWVRTQATGAEPTLLTSDSAVERGEAVQTSM